MKLLSITLLMFLISLQQTEGGYQVIRMGGYLWVSVDGRPYVRLSPELFGEQFVRQDTDENLYRNRLEINEQQATMNDPKKITTGENGGGSSLMKRNPAWNYVPRKKSYQKRLNYVRLAKRANYIRLSKRDQYQEK